MSYSVLGQAPRWESSPWGELYAVAPRGGLGQWEMVGSVAASSSASYGTMLWGESEVSEFFSTTQGQVITYALNAIGMIWGIPIGSIVQSVAEMFGGLFGGGLSHKEREQLEVQRATGHYRTAVLDLQATRTFTQLYQRMIFWNSKYVGGECGGQDVNHCIEFSVRPLVYARPDVQPVTATGVGKEIPGIRDEVDSYFGSFGLWRRANIAKLPLDRWPWIKVGYPSFWYATVSERGFYRAILKDPARRFNTVIQLGVAEQYKTALNKQLSDVIRHQVAKILQRQYGPQIRAALALAERTKGGQFPTPAQTSKAIARATAVAQDPAGMTLQASGGMMPLVVAGAVGLWLATQGGGGA